MNKYEKAIYEILCLELNVDIRPLQELVERATQLNNILNTPVENLTKEEYDVRNAYIFIKKTLDWSE